MADTDKPVAPAAEVPARFSIIVPARNSAGTVVRLLASIAKQTFDLTRVEVIAVDDASTDSTPFVLERFGGDLPRFRILHNDRSRGCGGARNRGRLSATGQYVWFCDSDDYLTERALERIDDALAKADDPDVCMVPVLVKRREGMQPELKTQYFKTLQEAAFGAPGAWAQVVRRSIAASFPEGVMSEDVAWHFVQFDRFETMTCAWSPETGEKDGPCYVYDRSVDGAISDTNSFINQRPHTLEELAFDDVLVKAGKKDKWVSDSLRNIANMYDLRHLLRKPWVKEAWRKVFASEAANLRAGFYCK